MIFIWIPLLWTFGLAIVYIIDISIRNWLGLYDKDKQVSVGKVYWIIWRESMEAYAFAWLFIIGFLTLIMVVAAVISFLAILF